MMVVADTSALVDLDRAASDQTLSPLALPGLIEGLGGNGHCSFYQRIAP